MDGNMDYDDSSFILNIPTFAKIMTKYFLKRRRGLGAR